MTNALLTLPLVLFSTVAALGQQPGAIFTTDRFSAHVDGNNYDRKGNIALVGGPGLNVACSAPGLVDDDYYFQITDPAATTLLSREAIDDRRVRVQNGVIAAYLGRTHNAGGVGPCGTILVQLLPFLDTPSPHREYKLWLTRVADYDANGSGLFGFDPKKSKSDNFRIRPSGSVVPQTIVRGRVFYDYDQNGTWNPGTSPLEVPIGGWRVEISRNGLPDGFTFTDQDGWYVFIRDRDGSTRTLSEKAPGGYVEDAIAGATWTATTPRSGTVVTDSEQVTGVAFGNVHFEVSAGSGRSVEFWAGVGSNPAHSSPGAQILQGSDPDWRIALNVHAGSPVNLRNPVSNDNPSSSIFSLNMPPQSFNGAFANWKSWVNKNAHDHAGFLLSRQVAATLLNNQFGFMQGSILIDRFQTGVLVPLEVMLAGAIGLLSQTGAGLTGPNDPYQDLRHMMIMCVNEFGSINNTGDIAMPQVVYSRSNTPALFTVPYD